MSKTASISLPSFFGQKQKVQKSITVLKNVRTAHPSLAEVNPFYLWTSYTFIALNILVILSYLFGVNNYASEGYQIKTIQNRLAALNETSNKLNQKISEHSSIVAIQNSFSNSNFVPTGPIKYLSMPVYTER